jgi:predicted ATPase
VAERVRDRFEAGTAFVPLASVTRPEQVVGSIARAVGADLRGAGAPVQALVEQLGEGAWLLILDNVEQVVGAAGDLGELLSRSRGVTLLATSRTVLGLRGEREYPVAPLPLAADLDGMPIDELATSPAVALFVDRARAIRPDFTLTGANARAVVGICRRVEGMPLAIELAAARTRLLEPAAILRRLSASLDALGKGGTDLPERQRTLRATVDWSVGLLDDSERSLLETMAVFVDGWTIEAAADVAELEENGVLELTEALARHSLVQLDRTEFGRPRMLETVREFIAERLAARPDVADVQRRHAHYFAAFAEQADRPLRGIGHNAWLDRLEPEAGNLAVAAGWYMVHERSRLPHLFRVLWLFWELRDHVGEARATVDELLPTAESLDPQSRAELLWTAVANAAEVGDDQAALSASQQLAPLLEQITDPFLRAVSQLAISWTAPIRGDIAGALRRASTSLAELRGQDEPYWTAVTAISAGTLEMAVDRNEDASGHLREAHELGQQYDYVWLVAWSLIQLGTLTQTHGRMDEARALLDEGLAVSLATQSARNITLCLAAYAQLAFAEGDPQRAALLAGATEGLRRRVGLRAWPMLRPPEALLLQRIRAALGTERFDRLYASGSRLNQAAAVNAVRSSDLPPE